MCAAPHSVFHFCTLPHTVLEHARQGDCVCESKTNQTSIQLCKVRGRARERVRRRLGRREGGRERRMVKQMDSSPSTGKAYKVTLRLTRGKWNRDEGNRC